MFVFKSENRKWRIRAQPLICRKINRKRFFVSFSTSWRPVFQSSSSSFLSSFVSPDESASTFATSCTKYRFANNSRLFARTIFIKLFVQPTVPERAPLIIETDYFPRPGYDGYCLLGQEEPPDLLRNNNSEEEETSGTEDTRRVLVEAGLLLTRSIDIDLGGHRVMVTSGGQPPEARLKPSDVGGSEGSGGQNTPSNYPRGILTPERSRARAMRRNGESLKAVSFNPRTECLLLEDI